MRTKKWILPIGIVCGVTVLCLIVVIAFGAILSSKGYGISTGLIYFTNNSTYLIDNNMAMRVSDCSTDRQLFKGYQNGDKVILFHDGVEETYPSQTGGYHIFRIAKGDGTYQPTDEVLGSHQLGGADNNLPPQNVAFDVQYIRTGKQNYEGGFPAVAVIHSAEELAAYYEANKDRFYLEQRENPGSDNTMGYLDACDKYDAKFFEKNALVFIVLEEGSGSIRHEVETVKTDANGILYINILSIVPEVGTCDMAYWHIMTEIPQDQAPDTADDVLVYYNGAMLHHDKITLRLKDYRHNPVFLDLEEDNLLQAVNINLNHSQLHELDEQFVI